MKEKLPGSHFAVRDDENDFYGKQYWTKHLTEDYGFPSILERSGQDLTERALFWISRVLEYRPPGGSYLEIGCAHGGSVYLMQQTGFDASGVEMSQWVIDFAKDKFGVDIVPGPVETSSIRRTFDCIASFDVLEHVEDPVTTVRWCREHLASDGVLFLQTPCYRGEDACWSQFKESDHVHLFTEGAIRSLLEGQGFRDIEITDSLFPYDMWVVASTSSLPERRKDWLADVPPVMRALLELRRRLDQETQLKADIDLDRHRKQEVVDSLAKRVEELDRDRALKAEAIDELGRRVAELAEDQKAKAARLEEVSAELSAIERDRQAKAEDVSRLSEELAAIDADRAAKATDVAKLHEIIEHLRRENDALASTPESRSAHAGTDATPYAEPRLVTDLDECAFYHSIELPEIGLIEGQWDLRGRFDDYVAEVDVRGRRVLDVGTASGFLTFEAERRGAEVVSFDPSSAALTTPLPLKYIRRDRAAHDQVIDGHLEALKNSYWLSHRLLESRAKVHYGNILSLPASLGTFDIAIVGQTLTHVRDPVGALTSISERCRETLIVADAILDLEDPAATFVGGRGDDTWAWWHLSFALYRQVLRLLGFTIETVRVDTYPCRLQGQDVGVSTLVAHRED